MPLLLLPEDELFSCELEPELLLLEGAALSCEPELELLLEGAALSWELELELLLLLEGDALSCELAPPLAIRAAIAGLPETSSSANSAEDVHRYRAFMVDPFRSTAARRGASGMLTSPSPRGHVGATREPRLT